MGDDAVLESLLHRVREGDAQSELALLGHLAAATVFVPAFEVQDDSITSKVKVATFAQDRRRLIPAFTDRVSFEVWAAARYECFPIIGANLALSLPEGTWIVLNPGQPGMLELAPALVTQIPEAPEPDPSVPIPDESDHRARIQQPSEYTDLLDEGLSPYEFVIQDDADGGLDELSEFTARPDALENLNERICSICATFPEVEEAYLQCDPIGETCQCVVGLLTSGLDAERRFLLIDKIAELSRELLGSAGALEVYDDLDVKTSRSWELFNALSPIYEKPIYGRFGAQGHTAPGESTVRGLAQGIERRGDSNADDENNLTWNSVRKTGSKILGAIRGVIRQD